MAEPHVVTALIRKRAEIAGQLEAAQNQALAQHFMAEWGMNTADKATVKLIGKRVRFSLRDMRNTGRITSEKGPADLLVWEIVR